MDRLTRKIGNTIEFVDGKGYDNLSLAEGQKLLFERTAAYEESGLNPEQITELQSEKDKLKKAFALACRCLGDYLSCPAVDEDANYPECNGEMDKCGDTELWECWQRYFIEKVEKEAVCRVCGCTWNNACEGGCYWVEQDLCSKCAEEELFKEAEKTADGKCRRYQKSKDNDEPIELCKDCKIKTAQKPNKMLNG